MKPLLVAGGVVIGLTVPVALFTLTILTLAAVDVEASRLGIGQD